MGWHNDCLLYKTILDLSLIADFWYDDGVMVLTRDLVLLSGELLVLVLVAAVSLTMLAEKNTKKSTATFEAVSSEAEKDYQVVLLESKVNREDNIANLRVQLGAE